MKLDGYLHIRVTDLISIVQYEKDNIIHYHCNH